jgi:hypothetical protein
MMAEMLKYKMEHFFKEQGQQLPKTRKEHKAHKPCRTSCGNIRVAIWYSGPVIAGDVQSSGMTCFGTAAIRWFPWREEKKCVMAKQYILKREQVEEPPIHQLQPGRQTPGHPPVP